MKLDIWRWLVKNKFKTDKGEPLEFKKHRFLGQYLEDFSNRIAVMKSSQVGVSLTTLFKLIYLADQSKSSLSIIYTLPTGGVMGDFVKTKFDPIIEFSSLESKEVSAKEKVSSVKLKRIGNSFFFFRGGISQAGAQSVAGDILVTDEYDFQSPEIIQMFEERLGGSSSLNISWYLSVPSLPGAGISGLYEKSDQKEWWVKCPHCGKFVRLVWPDSIDDINKRFICTHCKMELSDEDRRMGLWKAAFPKRKLKGYHISKLYAPWVSASQLLESFKNKDPKHFYRFDLGLPWRGKTVAQLMENFKSFLISEPIELPKSIIGIDQGNTFQVLELKVSPKLRLITDIRELSSFEDLKDYLTVKNPSLIVMDSLPNRHTALRLTKEFPGKTFLASERTRSVNFSEKLFELDGVFIKTDRTEILDHLFYLFEEKILKIWDKIDVDLLKNHLSNLIPEEKVWNGMLRRMYKKAGPTDYAFALSFAILGAEYLCPYERPKIIQDIDEEFEKGEEKDFLTREYEKEFESKVSGDSGPVIHIAPKI